MRLLKKILKGLGLFILFLIIFLLILSVYIYQVSDLKPPTIENRTAESLQREVVDSTHFKIGNCFLQKNKFGLYEMYIEGDDFERGVIYGKLAKELIEYQEQAFTNEIQRMIPSPKYLKFLKYIIGFMNRDLTDFVIPEYQHEIYGISLSASEKFNWIGSNYSRQMNYHAAHDIGHALANMMLVGCTSFATWDEKSKDSILIIGRNFDFYVGDDFAKNKIVAFYNPTKGHPFMSVIWGGFTGVVSGMNNKGISVTINAAKSSVPSGAATPVSLVAREILQYASNIDEAIQIAKERKMFVSESFLIGSAADNKAVVIEKTPDDLGVYESNTHEILCANHYQSEVLKNQKLNKEQIQNSASLYRYNRLQELLNETKINTPERTAQILRDYKGQKNQDIGLSNEKAVNQFIAHHSIIFEPKNQKVWVSTSPWQLGEYVCYDLTKIFSNSKPHPLYDEALDIKPDTLLYTKTFQQLENYLVLEKEFQNHHYFQPQKIVKTNPNYYDSYRIAGDIYSITNKKDSAIMMYQKALQYEIATQDEKKSIEEKIVRLKKLKP
ncbi:MAG TPA: C45 family autoproteolytic acyltransferase/hydrolase [Chitinophagaceae bacterium]|nr:C45 family autoproteolytic acyltransferase/hydrolase [Chitinophagaceae bacterium]